MKFNLCDRVYINSLNKQGIVIAWHVQANTGFCYTVNVEDWWENYISGNGTVHYITLEGDLQRPEDVYKMVGLSKQMDMYDAEIAQGEQLDKIASDYGLHRYIQTDVELRSRILDKLRNPQEDDSQKIQIKTDFYGQLVTDSTHPDVKTRCKHSWRSYVGLNQSFEYCEKCDEKKV